MIGAAHPDWLLHHLAVTGPGTELARFRAAAAGPGHVPWRFLGEQIEEDLFLRLMAASAARTHHGIGTAGARRMAERLREAAQHRAERIAEGQTDRVCAFDLHALIPVPVEILDLGPAAPLARAWLWQNWGTPAPLRHVEERASATEALRVRFWSAEWSPWRAIAHLRTTWPGLRFDIRPIYTLGEAAA